MISMKTLIPLFLLIEMAVPLTVPASAQSTTTAAGAVTPFRAEGILQSVENANVTPATNARLITRRNARIPVTMVFTQCQAVGVQYADNQWWVLPISATGARIDANRALWVLPRDAASKDSAWHLTLHGGMLSATKTKTGLQVTLDTSTATLVKTEARPRSDVFGNQFAFSMSSGAKLGEALAAFYWGTMLPSVVEKTTAAHYLYNSGYVLSTLSPGSYAGAYPAVDFEFQIRGRLAMGSVVDLDVVRRMLRLQFKTMQADPEELYRVPISIQPDGQRQYHVRRDSEDRHVNAGIFTVTGNTEVIEESWRYYEATKDTAWLRANIENLEHAAGWILENTDPYGRVCSGVYYEDQVIKDGRVTIAQAFAAHAFALLAGMEKILGRHGVAARYAADSHKMASILVTPLPMGYWDAKNQRFIDWVDYNGVVHDHIPLLANELPVTFGYASAEQAAAVRQLIKAHEAEFELFPSFVAADIAAYTKSEIGTGGPYDLCAAGRYWYWDAAYREEQRQNSILLHQLVQVADEAAKSNYFMGERYSMDHVYYLDGKYAHGAKKYYEYPNVFAAVLIGKYLGLTIPADADVKVAPHLECYGSVKMDIPQYALQYSYNRNGFSLRNLADKSRRFDIDLSALGFKVSHLQLDHGTEAEIVGPRASVTLAAHGEAKWMPEK